MVNINNSINSIGHLGTNQNKIRHSETNFPGLSGQKTNTKTDKNFSKVLENQANTVTKKVEQPKSDISTYSPLMLRYGVNRINEIKDIAVNSGIDDLTNEDFDYAIRYGKSLLADYLV